VLTNTKTDKPMAHLIPAPLDETNDFLYIAVDQTTFETP